VRRGRYRHGGLGVRLVTGIGDVFDFAYKSNMKNLRIYEESLYDGRDAAARHWGFFVALFVGVATVVAAVVFGIIGLVRAI
jgi:hypothetical protein